MPPGTPHHGCLYPYYPQIRVDEFTNGSDDSGADLSSAIYLLTHTHSDHIVGLQAKSFAQSIVCSADAKEMLLRHEVFKERDLHEKEIRAEKVRTYDHLKVDPIITPSGEIYYQGSRDLLKPIPLNTPTELAISATETVMLTLLDANHCPGSVMYLIEGARGNVLHTGDFRAEPWFLTSMQRNPFLQPYLSFPGSTNEPVSPSTVGRSLDAIFLDTACVMQTDDVPTKESAVLGLISLMRLYPKNAKFFINTWTWGYEDILKAVAKAFNSKIHVDRYKGSIYRSVSSDPLLRSLCTFDASSTRFHACERFDRCDVVNTGEYDHLRPDAQNAPKVPHRRATNLAGDRVIYVNPVSSMNTSRWELYVDDTRRRLAEEHEIIDSLLVPLNRHSPLPELQSFVSLFRPHAIVPNTLDPTLQGLDQTAIERVFAPYLHTPPPLHVSGAHTRSEIKALTRELCSLEKDAAIENDLGDVSLKNLVGGDSVLQLASRWASMDLNSRMGRKLSLLKEWLGLSNDLTRTSSSGYQRDRGHVTVSSSPAKDKENDFQELDDTDDSDADEERGRTAHALFGYQAGVADIFDYEAESSMSIELDPEEPVTLRAGPSRVLLTPPTDEPVPRRTFPPRTKDFIGIQLSSPIRFLTPSKDKGKKRALSYCEEEEDCLASPSVKRESPSTPKRQRQLFSNIKNVTSPSAQATRRTPRGLRLVTATPPSQRSKAAELSKRLEIAERLAVACPDRVNQEAFEEKRRMLRKRRAKAESVEAMQKLRRERKKAMAAQLEDEAEPVDSQFDYERQHALIRDIQKVSNAGKRLLLPELSCTKRPSL